MEVEPKFPLEFIEYELDEKLMQINVVASRPHPIRFQFGHRLYIHAFFL